MKVHVKEALLVITVLIVLIVIFTFPAILHLSKLLIGDGGDNYDNFIFQFIAFLKLKAFAWPFVHLNIFRYPVGFDFAIGYESALTVFTGALLSFFVSSIVAYNLTVLFFYFLNGVFSFALFRHISKSNLIGLIGSIIYGFSFFVIARSAGHINLFFLGGFILLIYSFIRIKDSFSKRNILLMLSAGLLVVLGSFLYSIIFSIAFFLCLIMLLIFYPSQLKSVLINAYRAKYKIILLAIPFIVVAFIFSYPHINALITGNYNKPVRSDYNSMFYASPSLKDYVLPNTYLPLKITNITKNLNDSARGIDKSVFLGWVELLLFAGFLLFSKNVRLKLFLGSSTLLLFIFTLGFIVPETKLPLPYYYFHKLPVFSFIDEPSRFYPVMYLFITIGIVLFLVQIYIKGSKKALLLLAVIAALLILERLPSNYWLVPVYKDNAFAQVVQKQNTAAVLDIPVSYTNSFYHLLPYIYDKKVVTGTFQWFADTKQTRAFIEDNGLIRFMCDSNLAVNPQTAYKNIGLIQTLKNTGIKTIVVHKNDLIDAAKFYFPSCANMRMQTTLLLPQLLKPNPTSKTQIISLFFPANPQTGDTITFSGDGIFTIEGLQAYPIDWLPLHIFLDGKEIQFRQTWTDRGGKNATFDPTLKINVKQGSKLKFQFNKNQNKDYSFVKLWYLYQTTKNNPQLDPTGQIIKIFEDDNAAVFSIK